MQDVYAVFLCSLSMFIGLMAGMGVMAFIATRPRVIRWMVNKSMELVSSTLAEMDYAE